MDYILICSFCVHDVYMDVYTSTSLHAAIRFLFAL
jgi:hypothetical protein